MARSYGIQTASRRVKSTTGDGVAFVKSPYKLKWTVKMPRISKRTKKVKRTKNGLISYKRPHWRAAFTNVGSCNRNFNKYLTRKARKIKAEKKQKRRAARAAARAAAAGVAGRT
jgi:hypothetical protein